MTPITMTRGWQVILVNGSELNFETEDLVSFIKSRRFVSSLFIVFVILVATDPKVFTVRLGYMDRALFWAFAIAVYVGQLLLGMSACRAALAFVGIKRFYLPVVSIPVLLTTTVLSLEFGCFVFGTETLGGNATLNATMLLSAIFASQCFEFVIANWIFAEHLREGQGAGAMVEKKDLLITSNGSIDVSQLIYLEAREHYVNIVQVGETMTVRSTLAALTNQLPDSSGFQIHRSIWVAKTAMDRGGMKLGAREIKTRDGRHFTVARSRQKAFTDWCESHLR
jgi:hypothetical protein